MTTDPLRDAEDALREAQEACRAAWDACELAIQDVAASRRLLQLQGVDATDRAEGRTTTIREVKREDETAEDETDRRWTFERLADAERSASRTASACEECDHIDGHTIWCSRRWGGA